MKHSYYIDALNVKRTVTIDDDQLKLDRVKFVADIAGRVALDEWFKNVDLNDDVDYVVRCEKENKTVKGSEVISFIDNSNRAVGWINVKGIKRKIVKDCIRVYRINDKFISTCDLNWIVIRKLRLLGEDVNYDSLENNYEYYAVDYDKEDAYGINYYSSLYNMINGNEGVLNHYNSFWANGAGVYIDRKVFKHTKYMLDFIDNVLNGSVEWNFENSCGCLCLYNWYRRFVDINRDSCEELVTNIENSNIPNRNKILDRIRKEGYDEQFIETAKNTNKWMNIFWKADYRYIRDGLMKYWHKDRLMWDKDAIYKDSDIEGCVEIVKTMFESAIKFIRNE